MNNFKDITDYAGLSKSVLNYMDVLKILKIFGEIRDIKKDWGLVEIIVNKNRK